MVDGADRSLPRYPVYIPTRGRWSTPYTARVLERDRVPFRAVVVPSEVDQYAEAIGRDRLLVLPRDDYTSVIPARNWIIEHAIAEGHARHWQLDDNMTAFLRGWRGRRIYVSAGIALRVCEDFTDRYENVAISGLNYDTFVQPGVKVPFNVNVHVYSCSLVNNAIPHRWRGDYNEDTDLCLQVLSDGWCTVLLNAFACRKLRTMTAKGGNTAVLYQGDGRLKMARHLERLWPGVVTVTRRYGRPQHSVDWRKFRQPLVRRADVDFNALPPVDEYDMRIVEKQPVKSEALRRAIEGA